MLGLLSKRKGQATLEYVIVLVAIIAAILVTVGIIHAKIADEEAVGSTSLFGRAEARLEHYTSQLPGAK